MLTRISFCVFLYVISRSLFAEPITFLDINLKMNLPERIAALENRGFKCKNRQGMPHQTICQRTDEWDEAINEFYSYQPVLIMDEESGYFYFACAAYKGCDHSINDIDLALVDKLGIVGRDGIEEIPLWGKVEGQVFKGEDGDRLILSSMEYHDEKYVKVKQSFVILFRGIMGKKLDF